MAEELRPWEIEAAAQQAQAPLTQEGSLAMLPWEESRLLSGDTATGAEGFGASTERLRTFAKGATFNFSDDIEAGLRSILPGETYQEAKQDINQRLEQYQRDNPGEALTMEVLGSIVPSVVTTYLTRGRGSTVTPEQASTVLNQIFPGLAKTVGMSAVESGLASIGEQEGNILSRLNLKSVTESGAGGAIGGGIYAVGKGAGGLLGVGIDALRVISRRTGQDAINRELQRIMSDADVSPEEAVEMLMRGDIVPSNPVVAEEIQALRARSRGASSEIYERQPLVAERQAEVMDVVTEGLAAGMPKNVQKAARASNEELKKVTNKAYASVRGARKPAAEDLQNSMIGLINRFPSGGRKLNEAFRSQSGRDLFAIDGDGVINFKFIPSVMDAEYLRRVVRDEGAKLIEKGGADATIGNNLVNYLSGYTVLIDNAAPGIQVARRTAQTAFEANDAYRLGRKMLNLPNDEVENTFLDVAALNNPDAMASLRLGYLAALKAGMGGKNKKSYIDSLLDETQARGMNFRTVFPDEFLPDALEKLGVSSRVAQAYQTMLGGSPTARLQQSIMRQGATPAARTASEVMSAGRGDLMAGAGVIDKIIRQFKPDITDEQAAEVTKILLSTDPLIITKAMTDKTALRSIQTMIAKITGSPLQALAQNISKNITQSISEGQ